MRKIVSLLTFMLLISVVSRSQGKVSGVIRDQNGDPVPFATITVKGTKISAVADANANFAINAKSGEVLHVTAVGCTPLDITVGESSSLIIGLTRSAGTISDVIVTTALGVQRQAKSLGYSTAKVSSQDLTQAKVTNVGAGLAAKVSGLQVNLVNNGVKPDVRVTLRGNRSILGNNQALLVVDDIQLPISYLGTLNPDDVDNVTVLKGASASALYGSSASNGVIIVTTKKGTKGKPRVTFSTTETVETVSYLPKFQNDFGQFGGETAPQYPGVFSIGDNPFIFYVPYENQNYGPRFNGQEVPLGPPIRVYKPDGSYTIQQDSIKYSADPKAKSGFFDKGLTAQNEVSYSSGDDKGTFYLSFQDVHVKGVNPGDHSQRDAIRINGSRNYGIFSASYNIGYTIRDANTTASAGVPFTWGTTGLLGGYAGGGSYFQNRPLYWEIVNQPADVNLRNYKNWQTDPFASPDGYFNAYYGNPWWQIDQTRLDERSNDLLGEISLSLKPTTWLALQFRSSIARNDYNNKYTQAGYTFADWAIADTLGSGNIPSSVKAFSPSEGDGISYNQILTNDFIASAHKTYGDFDVRLIGGAQSIDSKIRVVSTSASALVIPDFYNISNRLGTPNASEYFQQTRLLGAYGDLAVGYKNYLFAHASVRNDWNSLLSENNRSYLYPAADVAFIFTNAISALKNNNILSYGKIRAALSRTEQVSIGAYSLQNTFNVGGGFPFTGLPAGSVAGYTTDPSYKNPDIKPETSTDGEIGLELGFLQDRIKFGAAVYNTDTKDQTIPIQISSSTGYTQAYVNSGTMNNRGIELDLTWTVISNSNLKWSVSGNYSYNKNTVKSLGYGLTDVVIPNTQAYAGGGVSTDAVVGLPYGQIKTFDWNRDPEGRIIVDPTTGLPSESSSQKLFGTSVAPTKIGLSTSLTYKNFTFAAVADGRFGAVIYNGIGNALDFTGVSWYSAQTGRQPFVLPNSVIDLGGGKYAPNTGTVAYGTGSGPLPGQGAQIFWAGNWNNVGSTYVNSADFWKLREVSLTYNFSPETLRSLHVVNALSIGLVGRNLLMIKAKDNPWTDPEFANTTGNATGFTDLNQLPPTRFYGINLTVTF
jgi:TonB-linked SusC/RagA family outer membrane protein